MTHPEKSAGGRLLSDNDSQTEEATVSRDQATATLAGAIASDASILIELIEDVINTGDSGGNALSGAIALLARVGAMADAIAESHGGCRWRGDAAHWLMIGELYRDAYQALESKVRA